MWCLRKRSSGHVLWDCEVAEAVWRESKLVLPKLQSPLRDFIEVVWKRYGKTEGRSARSPLPPQLGVFGKIEML